jgi:hypothetical protein
MTMLPFHGVAVIGDLAAAFHLAALAAADNIPADGVPVGDHVGYLAFLGSVLAHGDQIVLGDALGMGFGGHLHGAAPLHLGFGGEFPEAGIDVGAGECSTGHQQDGEQQCWQSVNAGSHGASFEVKRYLQSSRQVFFISPL